MAKTGQQVLVEALAEVLGELENRIGKLEQRLPSAADIDAATRSGAAVHDRGLWTAAECYQPGDLVTAKGPAWCATMRSTGMTPGSGAGWRLLNKTKVSALRRLVREEIAQQKGSR